MRRASLRCKSGFGEKYYSGFHEANNKLSFVKYESNVGWLAPPPGYFKVNVDGASPLDGNGTSSVGAIVRNSDGKVVAALCKALPSIYPAD